MINCPKCGTPNPDNDTVCRACGGALAGQAFAQAMDRANEPAEAPAEAAPAAPAAGDAPAPEAASAVPPSTPAAVPAALDPVPASGGGFAFDPVAAQADIDNYMKAEKVRKAKKTIIYLVIFLIAAGLIGFLAYRSNVKEQEKKEAAAFLKAFFEVNNGSMAGFWRCVVRAKHKDVHLMNPGDVVAGLDGVFKARPKSQGDYIRRKCLPMLAGTMTELDALKPPPDFKPRLEDFKKVIPKLRSGFEGYIKKMEKAKTLASNEKEVVAAAEAFHAYEQTDRAKVVGYVNLMLCVVPDLPEMAKKVKKAPDVQPLVEHIQAQIKADLVAFANKLRKDCFAKLSDISEPKSFKLINKKMGGEDPRDVQAIKYTFKRAWKGFFQKDLDAIGTGFTEYRNAVVKVSQVADKFKDKKADDAPKKKKPAKKK
ncbi:MAG: hypothetical protein CSA65_06920 [Proteobacteria bacterium]|nr:MAG: hypothetical protein CSB49_05435 [Pseudomonadota bacterium]PIE17880.1 MAG: hypothetical protein CSA65_06920 [Pseudomonadota bacterium]